MSDKHNREMNEIHERVNYLILRAFHSREIVLSPLSSRMTGRVSDMGKAEPRKFKYILMRPEDFDDLFASVMKTSRDQKEAEDIVNLYYRGHRIITSCDIEEGKIELI